MTSNDEPLPSVQWSTALPSRRRCVLAKGRRRGLNHNKRRKNRRNHQDEAALPALDSKPQVAKTNITPKKKEARPTTISSFPQPGECDHGCWLTNLRKVHAIRLGVRRPSTIVEDDPEIDIQKRKQRRLFVRTSPEHSNDRALLVTEKKAHQQPRKRNTLSMTFQCFA
jgi:hypothetical protein